MHNFYLSFYFFTDFINWPAYLYDFLISLSSWSFLLPVHCWAETEHRGKKRGKPKLDLLLNSAPPVPSSSVLILCFCCLLWRRHASRPNKHSSLRDRERRYLPAASAADRACMESVFCGGKKNGRCYCLLSSAQIMLVRVMFTWLI